MNYLELINAVLNELEVPQIEAIDEARLPLHIRVKAYINRANEEIIAYENWWFKKLKQDFDPANSPQNVLYNGNELIAVKGDENGFTVFYDLINYVKDKNGILKGFFEMPEDRSIMPEPFGSELIVTKVCMDINQTPNNPKYNHWKQRYNKAYAELRASGKPYDGAPIFKLARG